MWLFMAILSAVFAGLTAILAKCGIRKTDSDLATALRTIVVLVFSWIMVLVDGSITAIGSISIQCSSKIIWLVCHNSHRRSVHPHKPTYNIRSKQLMHLKK